MNRGCAVGCLGATAMVLAAIVWLNFAFAYERARAVSPDGQWVATAFIDGISLSAENERVHLWRWWQPRVRWMGCRLLEARNEAPIRLSWQGARLQVEHGFRPSDILAVRDRCGPVRVAIERRYRPYS